MSELSPLNMQQLAERWQSVSAAEPFNQLNLPSLEETTVYQAVATIENPAAMKKCLTALDGAVGWLTLYNEHWLLPRKQAIHESDMLQLIEGELATSDGTLVINSVPQGWVINISAEQPLDPLLNLLTGAEESISIAEKREQQDYLACERTFISTEASQPVHHYREYFGIRPLNPAQCIPLFSRFIGFSTAQGGQ